MLYPDRPGHVLGSRSSCILIIEYVFFHFSWYILLFLLVAASLETGATYVLSIASVGMFVCMCVCGQLKFYFNY